MKYIKEGEDHELHEKQKMREHDLKYLREKEGLPIEDRKEVAMKFKSHKDAWSSGVIEQPKIDKPPIIKQHIPLPLSGIRHLTPTGDPIKKPVMQPPGLPASGIRTVQPKIQTEPAKKLIEVKPITFKLPEAAAPPKVKNSVSESLEPELTELPKTDSATAAPEKLDTDKLALIAAGLNPDNLHESLPKLPKIIGTEDAVAPALLGEKPEEPKEKQPLLAANPEIEKQKEQEEAEKKKWSVGDDDYGMPSLQTEFKNYLAPSSFIDDDMDDYGFDQEIPIKPIENPEPIPATKKLSAGATKTKSQPQTPAEKVADFPLKIETQDPEASEEGEIASEPAEEGELTDDDKPMPMAPTGQPINRPLLNMPPPNYGNYNNYTPPPMHNMPPPNFQRPPMYPPPNFNSAPRFHRPYGHNTGYRPRPMFQPRFQQRGYRPRGNFQQNNPQPF